MIDPWTLSWTRMRDSAPILGPSRNGLPLKLQLTMSTISLVLGPSLPSYSQAKAAVVAPVKVEATNRGGGNSLAPWCRGAVTRYSLWEAPWQARFRNWRGVSGPPQESAWTIRARPGSEQGRVAVGVAVV